MTITAVTVVYREAKLLPHWLAHYRAIGVRRFIIGISDWETHGLYAQVSEWVSAARDVALVHLPDVELGGAVITKHELSMLRDHSVEGWVVPADLDELYEYPAPLAELTAERAWHKWVGGRFFDRVTMDGTIPADVAADVWDQFPLGCNLLEHFGLPVEKVMLVRSGIEYRPGHHSVPDDIVPYRFEREGIVHHFKWCGSIAHRIERAARRAERCGFDSAPNYWSISRFIANGSIDLLSTGLVFRSGSRPPTYSRNSILPLTLPDVDDKGGPG